MAKKREDQPKPGKEHVLKQAAVEFGQRVRQLRTAEGLTQQQLADRLSQWGRSYHQSTVVRIENGTRPTALEELIPLAAALRVSQREFFDDPSPADRAEHKVREAEQEMLRIKSEMDLEFTRIKQLRDEFRKTVDLYSTRVAALHEFDPDGASERLQVVENMRRMVESPEFNTHGEQEHRERLERERDRAEMIDAGEAEYQDHYPRID